MDEEVLYWYRKILGEALSGIADDVQELIGHLNASYEEILELSDLNGDAVKGKITLGQRGLALQNLGVAYRLSLKTLDDLAKDADKEWVLLCTMECQRLVKRVAGWCLGVHLGNTKAEIKARSDVARKAADALHDKPGGSRDKQAAIRSAWASGKYSSRDVCAEQECAALGISFSTARKALRNTPEPG